MKKILLIFLLLKTNISAVVDENNRNDFNNNQLEQIRPEVGVLDAISPEDIVIRAIVGERSTPSWKVKIIIGVISTVLSGVLAGILSAVMSTQS